jgi:hypothetical protein
LLLRVAYRRAAAAAAAAVFKDRWIFLKAPKGIESDKFYFATLLQGATPGFSRVFQPISNADGRWNSRKSLGLVVISTKGLLARADWIA